MSDEFVIDDSTKLEDVLDPGKGTGLELPEGFAGVSDYAAVQRDGHIDARFTIDPTNLDDAVGRLHRARIDALTVKPPSLDALFLSRYAPDPAGEGT